MCGIVGALTFSNNSFEITKKYITCMRDKMIHRGPDGAGVWISNDRKTGLGHRRLSIIDLSDSAAQPMSNEDNSVFVTFNGEIYNHQDIRKELIQSNNHKFKTNHSDTEVIIHAFEEWGIEAIHKFRGIFAFALWDDKKKELWLVRDRIGVKPLYYSIHDGRIVFASEIKALLADPNQKRAVNEESLYDYLSFITTPAPNTLFEGIKKLPCGSFLKITSNGDIREVKYYDPLDYTTEYSDYTEDDYCEAILSELRNAVNLRKVSDVPVGVFLSGGIDSSANAALFSEGESRPIKTFTIGYEGNYDSNPDETRYAKLMADKVGAEYHEYKISIDDLIDFLPTMIHLQDEPIADPVCVPVYYVSKLARDNGVIVCQVGEGADELFWGYNEWRTMLRLQNLANRKIGFIPQRLLYQLMKVTNRTEKPSFEYLKRAINNQPVFWGGAEAFTENEKHRLLSDRLQKKFHNCSSYRVIEPIYKRFHSSNAEKSVLNWMTYLDLNLRLPELLLMRVDKMSMGVSLEGRVPFLDHKFVELALSIPQSLKTKNDTLKYMLKKSVNSIIPDELIDRKKQGFGVPIYEWYFDKLGKKTEQELLEFCDNTNLLDKSYVKKQIEKKEGPKIWYLLNLALWWKEFIR